MWKTLTLLMIKAPFIELGIVMLLGSSFYLAVAFRENTPIQMLKLGPQPQMMNVSEPVVTGKKCSESTTMYRQGIYK
jgi:hypothetical protein